jgi:hypothetical protein
MKLQELLNTGEGVSIAIVPDGVENDREWNVYVINTKNEEIKNVMIKSFIAKIDLFKYIK